MRQLEALQRHGAAPDRILVLRAPSPSPPTDGAGASPAHPAESPAADEEGERVRGLEAACADSPGRAAVIDAACGADLPLRAAAALLLPPPDPAPPARLPPAAAAGRG